jgi:acyl carrier protein
LKEKLLENLLRIIADILQLDHNLIRLDTSPENTPEWDSFAHLAIVTAVEVEYGISFDFEEMFEVNSVSTLLDILAVKIG